MHKQPLSWLVLLIAAAILGIVPLPLCMSFAGAGHGTYVWFALFYGPLGLVVLSTEMIWLIPLIYSAYALLITIPRSINWSLAALASIVFVHGTMAIYLRGSDFRTTFDLSLTANLRAAALFCGILGIALTYLVVTRRNLVAEK